MSLPPDAIARLKHSLKGFETTRYIEDLRAFCSVSLDLVMQALGEMEDNAGANAGGDDDRGLDNFVAAVNLRQGMLNLMAVYLWHLFEQQRERLGVHATKIGVGCPASIEKDDAVQSLRLTAHTIKHGDGASAEKLRAKRPDLFVTPHWTRSDGTPESPFAPRRPRPLLPLAGEGIYVSSTDLSNWIEALVVYWEREAEFPADR